MNSEVERLRQQAGACLRVAYRSRDQKMIAAMNKLAAEFHAQAEASEREASKLSDERARGMR